MIDKIKALLELKKNGANSTFFNLAKEFRDKGIPQQDVYNAFMEVFCSDITVEGVTIVCDEIENDYLDTLDSIVGFCSDHLKLWENYLSNDQL